MSTRRGATGDHGPTVALRRLDLADEGERAALLDLLVAGDWPFHAGWPAGRAELEERLAGRDPQDDAAYWVEGEGRVLGVVELHDLGDDGPVLDLRVVPAERGRGVGAAALRATADLVFSTLPAVHRLEGTTREDNVAMRRTFLGCGFVQEAAYRQAWPTSDGRLLTSVAYGLLRPDWRSGTTTLVEWGEV